VVGPVREAASGPNNSRQTSLTYPNGRVLGYTYASGVDNAISRLSSITDGATTLESYSELGLDTIVKRAHPQSTYDQTFIKFSIGPPRDSTSPVRRSSGPTSVLRDRCKS
jgi:hypothetical protein